MGSEHLEQLPQIMSGRPDAVGLSPIDRQQEEITCILRQTETRTGVPFITTGGGLSINQTPSKSTDRRFDF